MIDKNKMLIDGAALPSAINTPKPATETAWEPPQTGKKLGLLEQYQARKYAEAYKTGTLSTQFKRNSLDAYKAQKLQDARNEFLTMDPIGHFNADSIAALGIGNVDYNTLLQMAYDGKIDITDPGDRKRLTVRWNTDYLQKPTQQFIPDKDRLSPIGVGNDMVQVNDNGADIVDGHGQPVYKDGAWYAANEIPTALANPGYRMPAGSESRKAYVDTILAAKMGDVEKLRELQKYWDEEDARRSVGKFYKFLEDPEFAKYASEGAGSEKLIYEDLRVHMTDAEIQMYNYLIAKHGIAEANKLVQSIKPRLTQQRGQAKAEEVKSLRGGAWGDIDYWLRSGELAFRSGLDQFESGFKQLFREEAVKPSYTQYANYYFSKDLEDVEKFAYGIVNQIGNMTPLLLTTTAASLSGIPAPVVKILGASMVGAPAAGNAYTEAIEKGYDKNRAKVYAALIGASEAGLQYLLGGMSSAGGIAADDLLTKVAALDNALFRFAGAIAVKGGAEALEENIQNFLEPLFRTMVFDEKYDLPTWEEIIYTSIVSFVSANLIEGSDVKNITLYGDGTNGIGQKNGEKLNLRQRAAQTIQNTVAKITGKKSAQNAQNAAGGVSAAVNTQTQVEGENAPVDAGANAAGANTQVDAATKKRQDAFFDALFGRNKKTVSEPDTVKEPKNMDSAEMRQKIEAAYAAGEMTEDEYDSALDALMEQESLEGVNKLDQYNPDMIKTEVNNDGRGSVLDESGERTDGESAGEQAGELAEGTGRDQSGQVQSVRARDRADAVARVYEAEGRQPVSGKTYLGSAYVADEGQIYDVPQSVIDGDQELLSIASEASGMGMTAHFFTGEARLINGRYADAMIRGNDVYIRVDGDKWTATQSWEHEKFHRIVSAAKTVVQDLWARLIEKTDPKKLRNTMKVYRDAYHGICDVDANGNFVWDENAMYRVVEEILADAYAGKDTFAQNVEEYSDTARDAASQIEERGIESRGPPENFAVVQRQYEEAVVNQDIVSFVEKVKQGNIKPNEKLYLGTVTDDIAKRIYELTGINVDGFRIAIEARQVEHILKDHGEYGAADRSMSDSADIGKMEYALQSPDNVIDGGRTNAYTHMVNGRNRTAPTVLYEKRIGAESYYVVQAVPNTKAKALYIVTAFKGQPGYQGAKKEAAQLINAQGPDATPESGSVVASNENLPQNSRSVKVEQSFSASGTSEKAGGEETANKLSDITDDLTADSSVQDPVQTLPKKAQRILETEERKLTNLLANALRIPYKSRGEQLDGIARAITTEFLQTGNVSEKTLDDLFESTYRQNEQTLAEKYGVDIDEYRDAVERDFKAQAGNLIAQLRLANRYAAEQAKSTESESSEQPELTKKDLEDLYANMKSARRTADKAVARNLLTESDSMKVNRLLRGDIDESMLNPLTDNVNGILEVFRAKAEYEKFARQIRRWNAQRKERLYALADKLLENAHKLKDKKSGFLYSRETMERNIRDMTDDKSLAEEIISELFTPVHKAAAKATKIKNEYRDRVRALKLSRKVESGDTISEAAAVQLLGEAEDNIRYLQDNKFVKERDGKTLEDWSGIVRDMWESNPSLKPEKIRKAVEEFRKIYDDLFKQMNDARMRNGYEPINYRKGYFPHFQSESGDGILSQFGKSLGINTAAMQLPTTINGMTHTFKPGIQWVGSAQQRKGVNTSFDAVEGFDSYIEGVADVICQTDNIQRLRAFATQVRYRTSDEGLRKQVDAVRNDPTIAEEDKSNRIKEIYENGKFELGNFAVELDEYTNLLAGKKSRHDRDMEQRLGRKWYAIMKAVESRLAANMVAVNPGSWLTNFIPITQGAATLDSRSLLAGMWDTLRAIKQDDGVVASSTFLTNRRGSDPIVRTWAQETSAKLSKPMELIDNFTAGTLVRARFNQNVRRGMSEEAAMADADAWAAGVMADRSKGATPTIFAQTNPITKLLTQFQVEVNNQLSYTFKDIPRETREKGAAALALAMLKFMLGAYLFDELYEYFIGRRPALDPLGIINDTVGDLTGYELPNLVELSTGLFTGDMPSFKVEKKGLYDAGLNLATSVAEELPFVGGLLGGGRLPINSALPDVGKLWQAASDDSWAGEKRLATAAKELAKPVLYILPPFGGGQVKKAAEGLDAVIRGGSYSVDNTGADILQYPVANDTFGQAGLNALSALFFGKSSLPSAREWVESNFDSLSAKQTALFDAMRDGGASTDEAYDLIRDVEAASGNLQKQLVVANGDWDEWIKELQLQSLMSENEYKRYKAARSARVSTEDFVKMLARANEIAKERGVKSASQKDIEAALNESGLTREQKQAIWNGFIETGAWKTESPW